MNTPGIHKQSKLAGWIKDPAGQLRRWRRVLRQRHRWFFEMLGNVFWLPLISAYIAIGVLGLIGVATRRSEAEREWLFLRVQGRMMDIWPKMYSVEDKSRLASQLSLEQIENLSDEEIAGLAVERPGHPGQHGFLLDPRHFKSEENLREILLALTKRLMATTGIR